MSFEEARKEAFGHISRFFFVEMQSCLANCSFAECWNVEIEVDHHGTVLCVPLHIRFKSDFPLSLPKIAIDPSFSEQIGYIPNIDSRGIICTFDDALTIPDPKLPSIVVEKCIRQAKEIIQRGINQDRIDAFQDEYLAYWENAYQGEKPVERTVLSLIDETIGIPKQITFVTLGQPLGIYNAVLYADFRQFEGVQRYLNNSKIRYTETQSFFLGELPACFLKQPPFTLKNRDVFALVKQLNQWQEFRQFAAKRRHQLIVTFAKRINNRLVILGWRHSSLKGKIPSRPRRRGKGRKRKNRRFAIFNYPENLVNRFSPQNLTQTRIQTRTAGDYEAHWIDAEARVLVAGLGSVGSNLVSLLESSGFRRFHFVDGDVMTIENIGKHLLGIESVGLAKVDGVRTYLEQRNPLNIVDVRHKRIVELALVEPDFIEICDYCFYCTGDLNAENWLAHHITEKWARPSFFIWVEPYLAGGHCIYLSGQDEIVWNELFIEHYFKYNVIPPFVHEQIRFTKREAGCQVSYIPFNALILKQFLSSLVPRLFRVIDDPTAKSRRFSWIGDLENINKMGIAVSESARQLGSFQLEEQLL